MTMTNTNRVLDGNFDRSRIIGVLLEKLDPSLKWDSAYPIIENGMCIGVVDGNWPDEYNDGKWRIVDDYYAVATTNGNYPFDSSRLEPVRSDRKLFSRKFRNN